MTIGHSSAHRFIFVTQGVDGYVAALSLLAEVPQLASRIQVLQVGEMASEPLTLCSSVYESHEHWQLTEQQFLAATGARISYGWRVVKNNLPQAFLTDAPVGAPIQGMPFIQFHAAHLASLQPLQAYCLAAQLAQENKVVVRGAEAHPAHNLLRCNYQVDAARYGALLQGLCRQQGITITPVESLQPVIQQGQVVALNTAAGEFAASLYFDCTRAGLLAEALNISRRPVFETAPIAVSPVPPENGPPVSGGQMAFQPQALVVETLCGGGGWCYQLAQGGLLGGQLALKNSQRSQAWVGNTLFLGEAYAQLPSFLVDPLHRVRSGVLRFINCWSANAQAAAPARVFNRRSQEELAGLASVDNYILHCAFGDAVPLLPDVAHKQALYQAQGRLALNESESLSPEHWQLLFYAMGERIREHELIVQGIALEAWQDKLAGMRRFFAQVVTQAPAV